MDTKYISSLLLTVHRFRHALASHDENLGATLIEPQTHVSLICYAVPSDKSAVVPCAARSKVLLLFGCTALLIETMTNTEGSLEHHGHPMRIVLPK